MHLFIFPLAIDEIVGQTRKENSEFKTVKFFKKIYFVLHPARTESLDKYMHSYTCIALEYVHPGTE